MNAINASRTTTWFIPLLLHALYDLFTSTQHQTGLARCLTTFLTVSTLQNCNFTSFSPKVFCSGYTIPADCPPRLLFQTRIALACIRIQFFAGNCSEDGVCMSVVATMRKMSGEKRGWRGKDETGNVGAAGVSGCCGQCRHVLDFP